MKDFPLSRPAPAPLPGPLDEQFYDLVEARYRRVLRDNPTLATGHGIHAWDGQLGSGTREAVLEEIAQDRGHAAAVTALDAAGLSPEVRFERELELHHLRESLFHAEEIRLWERRSFALDSLGDAMFTLIARDYAPLADRLLSIAARLEGVPAYLAEHRTRAVVPQVRTWQLLEIEAVADLHDLLAEIGRAGHGILDERRQRRLDRAIFAASAAIEEYAGWLRVTLAGGTEDWALGPEKLDELIRVRNLDGLTADDILAIGSDLLAEQRAARQAAAREIDRDATEDAVIDRIRGDHPATFAEALAGYRDAMLRAREHIVRHDLATIPAGERIDVIETPRHLRQSLPLAAYFVPPKFDPDPAGIYVVTPSVDDDPAAMREHNWSAISNTSIHEAYPGHHLQLSAARLHPSLSRHQLDATEFVEGWGMYCEQMMREHGFDDGPAFRVGLATDAIWRACRIVLDIRLQRGELGVEEGTELLREMTRFEPAVARAEVLRYTYTPTYQLSYLVGKVMLLRLREDERHRLGPRFRLRDFHDAMLRAGSLPIAFQRRVLAGEDRAATMAADRGRAADGDGPAGAGALEAR